MYLKLRNLEESFKKRNTKNKVDISFHFEERFRVRSPNFQKAISHLEVAVKAIESRIETVTDKAKVLISIDGYIYCFAVHNRGEYFKLVCLTFYYNTNPRFIETEQYNDYLKLKY